MEVKANPQSEKDGVNKELVKSSDPDIAEEINKYGDKKSLKRRNIFANIRKGINPVSIILFLVVILLSVALIFQTIGAGRLRKDLDKANMLHKAVYNDVQKIEVAGPTDRIYTYNYAYGNVAIPAIEGVAKSTYKYENFTTNDEGYKEYYIDGELRSYVGVDVSEHNGSIDWDQVRESGVSFAMLRIGGRGWGSEGVMYEDSMFKENLQGAKDAGLMVGAYFFSQAITPEEAVQEAEYVLSILDNESLDYPIAFDWETVENVGARTDDITPDTLTACARAFCDRISVEGYKPCLYVGTALAYYKYDLGELSDLDVWYAYYNDTPTLYYNYMIWQYASDGKVDGISGDVDLNICFKNYK